MKWHSSAPTTVPAKSSTRSGKNCDKRHRIINWIRKEVSVLGSSGGNNVFIAIRHFNDREVSGQMIRSLQLWLPISCSLELSSCQGLADAPEKNPQFQQHLDLLMSGPSECQSCFTTMMTIQHIQKLVLLVAHYLFSTNHLLRAILKEVYAGLHRLWSLQNSSCLHRLTWSSIPSLSASSSENSGSLSTSEGGGDGLRFR